ncbi:MAG TPA: hypothetical protein VF278_11430 [Pirellulales bacterium]
MDVLQQQGISFGEILQPARRLLVRGRQQFQRRNQPAFGLIEDFNVCFPWPLQHGHGDVRVAQLALIGIALDKIDALAESCFVARWQLVADCFSPIVDEGDMKIRPEGRLFEERVHAGKRAVHVDVGVGSEKACHGDRLILQKQTVSSSQYFVISIGFAQIPIDLFEEFNGIEDEQARITLPECLIGHLFPARLLHAPPRRIGRIPHC